VLGSSVADGSTAVSTSLGGGAMFVLLWLEAPASRPVSAPSDVAVQAKHVRGKTTPTIPNRALEFVAIARLA
jgi:hypothetical protein